MKCVWECPLCNATGEIQRPYSKQKTMKTGIGSLKNHLKYSCSESGERGEIPDKFVGFSQHVAVQTQDVDPLML